jgi:threonine dehydrogenase-like Zn-dependent dehydrogenase
VKGLYLTGDYEPRPGYVLTGRELDGDHRAINGNAIWKNSTLEVRDDIPMPEVGPKDVLVKVRYCGVCGSDVHFYETDDEGYVLFPGHSKLPVVIGHEFSGEVVETGAEVNNVRPGDLVTVEEMLWCGECTPCRAGYLNQCRQLAELGFTLNGAFAEYVVAYSKYVYTLNDVLEATGDEDMTYRAGALVEPTSVAYNGVISASGGIKPGQHVAVFGAGPIGAAAIQILRAAGAAKIFAFEMRSERRELARISGATHIFDPAELAEQGATPSDVVMELTKGHGVAMAVEAAGATRATVPEIEKALAVGGKMVQIGMLAGETPMHLLTFQFKRASMFGAIGHSGHENFPNVIQLMAAGRVDMTGVATATFPLDRALEAIVETSKRTGGKILVQAAPTPAHPQS